MLASGAQAESPCCAGLEECVARLADTASPEPEPDPRPLRRDCEASAVAGFGKDGVPRLLPLLESDDWRVRDGAAAALGRLDVPEAVPALIALDERDPTGWAGSALERIDDPRVVPALVRRLARGDGPGRTFPVARSAEAAPLVIAAMLDEKTGWLGLSQCLEFFEAGNGGGLFVTSSKRSLPLAVAKALAQALRGQLDAAEAGPPPPVSVDECTEPDDHGLVVGPCLPRIGFLVLALASFGARAAFAGEDIDRSGDCGPAMLEDVARRAGLAVGSPRTMGRLLEALGSGDAERARIAAWDSLLLGVDEPRIRAALVSLLRAESQALRVTAATVLARRGHTEGLEVLVEALSSPRAPDVEAALSGLSLLGEAARPAEPVLRRLLEQRLELSIRRAAAVVLTKLTGQEVVARPPPCGRRTGDFTLVSRSPRWCGRGVCIDAVFHGEFGGEATVKRGADEVALEWSSVFPRGLAEGGGRLYLLSGLSHLSVSDGALYRVILEPHGLRLAEVATLPAEPTAWRVEADGAVVVVTRPERGVGHACSERVLRIEPDGRVRPAP